MKYSLFKRLSNQAAASVPSGFSGDDWHREYDKKFAELIVRECIEIIEPCKCGCRCEQEVAITGSIIADIKEHFGVVE
jgi:hypothetical protein